MEKQIIINAIASKLNDLKLHYEKTQNEAFIVNTTLFKKGMLGIKREIKYEAVVSVKMVEKAIYIWESVVDIKKGFSFGTESESYTQNGISLHRKVYAKQIGANGESYEIELDLGEFGRFVSELTKKNDFKLKVVFKKEKAL